MADSERQPEWTEDDLIRVINDWPGPPGFRVVILRAPGTDHFLIRLEGPTGCSVMIALGWGALDSLPNVLDQGVHGLLRDHLFCVDECHDAALRILGRHFDRWIDRYLMKLIDRSLIRQSRQVSRERSNEPWNV